MFREFYKRHLLELLNWKEDCKSGKFGKYHYSAYKKKSTEDDLCVSLDGAFFIRLRVDFKYSQILPLKNERMFAIIYPYRRNRKSDMRSDRRSDGRSVHGKG